MEKYHRLNIRSSRINPLLHLAYLSTRLPLTQGRPYILGRDRSADFTLPDAHVSRRHALLYVINEQWTLVQDLDSVNGLFVDQERVPWALLRPRQQFVLGVIGLQVE